MNRKDPTYLDWIRQQECVECRAPAPSEAHHPRGHAYGTGTGIKAPDALAVPVCGRCHRRYHSAEFADPARTQSDWVARTLILAIESGMLKRPLDPGQITVRFEPAPLRFGFETKDD